MEPWKVAITTCCIIFAVLASFTVGSYFGEKRGDAQGYARGHSEGYEEGNENGEKTGHKAGLGGRKGIGVCRRKESW